MVHCQKFGGGLLLLSSISLVSTGFSAWTIGIVGNSAEAQMSVGAADVENMITFDSKSGDVCFSKYGFVDSEDKITDSYTFSYSFILNQAAARSAGYINNSSLTLKISLLDGDTVSKFIYLFRNGYLTANFGIIYNNINVAAAKGTYSGDYILASAIIPNVNDLEKELFCIDLTLNYVTTKSQYIETFFNTLTSDAIFSFSLCVEAQKTV